MAAQNWIGKRIGGRYEIDTLLGQGGMSAVYRATDPNLRRQVAIKLIHTHLSVNPDFVHRFKEEAAAVARLRHPNIVQVHDFNIDDGTYYMVMEYLIGETLQARLKRLNAEHRFMPLADVITICLQLCEAVGYAHNHELIHRDIKPANIMLNLNGQAILMDFGIVKIVGGEYHTATGATIGTAMYMSPEQIRSERADERSDIYSLGVTLYEMVSGKTPYKADSVVTLLMKVLNDPLPDLNEIRQGIPPSLSAVVEKALQKDQANRFQSMEDMAAALQKAQKEATGSDSVITVIEDEEKKHPDQQLLPAEQPQDVKPSSPIIESADIPQPETVIEDLGRVPRRAEGGISGVPTEVDYSAVPAAATKDTAALRVKESTKRNTRKILIAVAVFLILGAAVAVGYIYFASQRAPELLLTPINQPQVPIDAQTAQFVVSLGTWETDSFIEELAFSPDGAMLGTANNRELMQFSRYRFYGSLLGVDTANLQNYLLGHTQWVNSADFSLDGQLLATASDDAQVLLWKVSNGSLLRTIDSSSGLATADFSPNNLLLAAGTWDGIIGLWQVNDGHLLRTIQGHENSVMDVEFSPDGTLLASASEDNTIKLWQVGDGSPVHTLRGHTGPVHKLAFSPDGTLLASASDDKTLKLWQVRDGSQVRSLQGHSEPVMDVAFSADGSLIASGSLDATLRLWRVSDGELLNMLTDPSEGILSIDFSPDGYMLASGNAAGTLRFWGLSEAIPVETETP